MKMNPGERVKGLYIEVCHGDIRKWSKCQIQRN